MATDTSRVTTAGEAIRAQASAKRRRAMANSNAGRDPTGARWDRVNAADLEQKAKSALDPRNHLPSDEPLVVGVGGELVVATPGSRMERPWLVDTVRGNPDMV